MKQGVANRKISKPGAVEKHKPRREFSLARAYREGRKSALPVPVKVVLFIIVCLAAVGVAMATKSHGNPWLKTSSEKTLPGRRVTGASDDKLQDLNGMSMGEWMRKNNVNTDMMRERQQRLQQHQAGVPSQ